MCGCQLPPHNSLTILLIGLLCCKYVCTRAICSSLAALLSFLSKSCCWLCCLLGHSYPYWAMEGIYPQLIRAGRGKDAQHDGNLRPWELELARTLKFVDTGVHLKLQNVAEVANGNITEWYVPGSTFRR